MNKMQKVLFECECDWLTNDMEDLLTMLIRKVSLFGHLFLHKRCSYKFALKSLKQTVLLYSYIFILTFSTRVFPHRFSGLRCGSQPAQLILFSFNIINCFVDSWPSNPHVFLAETRVRSTQLCRMSFYDVGLKYFFTGAKMHKPVPAWQCMCARDSLW